LLCETLEHMGLADAKNLSLVFLTNELKQVMLCRQRADHGHAGLVVWDYHVFVVQRRQSPPSLIWDQDSILPLPCPGDEYALEAFMLGLTWAHPSKHRRFCEVPWEHARRQFASDRRHMRKAPPTMPQTERPLPHQSEIGTHTTSDQCIEPEKGSPETALPRSHEDDFRQTNTSPRISTAALNFDHQISSDNTSSSSGNSGSATSESGNGDMSRHNQARGNLAGTVEWQSPPPPWPCIQSPGAPLILSESFVNGVVKAVLYKAT